MAVALIKLTQGTLTDVAGNALLGQFAYGPVTVENGDNTGVQSWEIKILYVDPRVTTVSTGVLASGIGAVPPTMFPEPDAPGCVRIQLRVTQNGVTDTDIRNFGIRELEKGVIIPPFQREPPQRPLTGLGAKPDELNFGGQPFGWAGSTDPDVQMMHNVLKRFDTAASLAALSVGNPGDAPLVATEPSALNVPLNLTDDGTDVWVSNGFFTPPSGVARFNIVTGRFIEIVDLTALPLLLPIRIVAALGKIYVLDFLGTVAEITPGSPSTVTDFAVIGGGFIGMVFAGGFLWILELTTPALLKVDPTNLSSFTLFPIPAGTYVGLAFEPISQTLWATETGVGQIRVFDLFGALAAPDPVINFGVIVSPEVITAGTGSLLYVTDSFTPGGPAVHKLSATTGYVSTLLLPGTSIFPIGSMGYDAAGNKLWVGDTSSGTTIRIDAPTMTVDVAAGLPLNTPFVPLSVRVIDIHVWVIEPILLLSGFGGAIYRGLKNPPFTTKLIYPGKEMVFVPSSTIRRVTSVSASYIVERTDQYVGVNFGAASSVSLTVFPFDGELHIIQDESGAAAANNITIFPLGGFTINGAVSDVINTNWGRKTVVFNSTAGNWTSA